MKFLIPFLFSLSIVFMMTACKDHEKTATKPAATSNNEPKALSKDLIVPIDSNENKLMKLMPGQYELIETMKDGSSVKSITKYASDSTYTTTGTYFSESDDDESDEMEVEINGKWSIKDSVLTKKIERVQSDNKSLQQFLMDNKESKERIITLTDNELILSIANSKKKRNFNRKP